MTSPKLQLASLELDRFNQRLEGLDDELFPSPPESSNFFIVGPPRSGTTIVSQIMSYVFDIGYVNNLAATCWNAPAFGVTFANRFAPHRVFAGCSTFGATSQPTEPHEFGRFWRLKLDYESMVQKAEHNVKWDSLLRSLDQIGEAWQGRWVGYKVFQLAWHLVEFHRLRPNSKWIWVRRKFEDNTHSLMKLSAHRDEKWVSAVPLKALEIHDRDPDWQRASAQVLYLHEWLTNQFAEIESSAVHVIELEQLVDSPYSEIERLGDFLGLKPIARSRLVEVAKNLKPSPVQQHPDSAKIRAYFNANSRNNQDK